ncbi:MAG: Bax inhibitor-1/YccA family protein [Acidimicrobiales bacterium]
MMRTSNPALNQKIFRPETTAVIDTSAIAESTFGERGAPAHPSAERMTIGGVVEKSAFLLLLLVVGGGFGWSQVDRTAAGVAVPGWLLVALFGGLGIAMLTIFKPRLAAYTSPAYAVVQGLVVGALSALYESQFEGIVLQAVGLTVGVFAVMLALFALRIITVTDKLRAGVMMATGAVFLVYIASFVFRLLGANVPFIHDTGLLGIGFSLAVVVIASMNLLLDFDMIEKGAAAGAPKHLEWYGAFGLLVTIVWLYLELLRLLSKLRSR